MTVLLNMAKGIKINLLKYIPLSMGTACCVLLLENRLLLQDFEHLLTSTLAPVNRLPGIDKLKLKLKNTVYQSGYRILDLKSLIEQVTAQ